MTHELEMRAMLEGEEGPLEVYVDGTMINVKTVLGSISFHVNEFDRVADELAAYHRAAEALEKPHQQAE